MTDYRPKRLLVFVVLASILLLGILYQSLYISVSLSPIGSSGVIKPTSHNTNSVVHDAVANQLRLMDEQFGRRFFEKSVAYGGTNVRLRRALRKWIRGDPIRIGYLGGSVTAGSNLGHLAPDDSRWDGQLFRLLNDTFPNEENYIEGVALGGFGSVYFAWCGEEYIPDDADIIVLEHSVNNFGTAEDTIALENELRGMLSRQTKPAVLGVEFFGLWGSNMQGPGGMAANNIFRFYDAPYLSLRNPLLPEMIAHPERVLEFFGREGLDAETMRTQVNLGHVSTRGHYGMAAIVAHYIWSQVVYMHREGLVETEPDDLISPHPLDRVILGSESNTKGLSQEQYYQFAEDYDGWKDEKVWGAELYQEDIPRTGIMDPFDFDKERTILKPRCDAISGAKHKLAFETVDRGKRLNEYGQIQEEEGDGWYQWKSPQSYLDKQYVRTTSFGSVVRIRTLIEGQGDVSLMYLRSSSYGLGKAKCWIDDDEAHGIILSGPWEIYNPWSVGQSAMIAEGLPQGEHWTYCKLVEGAEFRLIALMTR